MPTPIASDVVPGSLVTVSGIPSVVTAVNGASISTASSPAVPGGGAVSQVWTALGNAAGATFQSAGASGGFVVGETPSGTVDGANKAYTLAHTPVTGSVVVYQNGARLKLTTDYTLSGSTVTFVVAPVANDILLADYRD